MFVTVQDKTTRLRMKKSFSGGNFLYSDTNYTDEQPTVYNIYFHFKKLPITAFVTVSTSPDASILTLDTLS